MKTNDFDGCVPMVGVGVSAVIGNEPEMMLAATRSTLGICSTPDPNAIDVMAVINANTGVKPLPKMRENPAKADSDLQQASTMTYEQLTQIPMVNPFGPYAKYPDGRT